MLKFVATFLFVVLLHLTGARPTDDNDELIAVAVVFRHGDRTIIDSYPNDPYLNYSWPVGLGQLTNAGKERHYELGQWFRKRYDGFLPKKYSEEDIYVRSTNVDRTLMSGAANLAGLYPPTGDQIWDDELLWQPIPIHTTPEEEDELLAMKKPCPKYTKMYEDYLKGEEITKLLKDNQDILDLCTQKAGKEYKTLEDIEYLHDALKIESEDFDLPVPEWTNTFFPNRSEALSGKSFSAHSATKDMARLKGGPFWYYLISHFQKVINKDDKTQKFLMFPAHDTTVANLLMSLDKFDYHPPPYASTLMFELRSGSVKPTITMEYRKSVEDISVVYSGTFEDFISKLEPVTVNTEEWEKECAGKMEELNLGKWLRRRYDGFLSPNYTEEELYVTSADIDVNIMSAAVNLAGLYPPEPSQVWNSTLPWQPIPIHTIPAKLDNKLAATAQCQKYDDLLTDFLNGEEMQKVHKDYQEEFNYCSEKTGKQFTSIMDFQSLHDTLRIEESFNLSLPEWTSKVYPHITKELSGLSYSVPAYTEDMARLKTGPFFNSLISHFQNLLQPTKDYTPEHQKFFIYSTPDTTVANILTAMNQFTDTPPEPASIIIFELRNPDEPVVNMFYQQSHLNVLEILHLEGCDSDCPWSSFMKILQPITINDEEWQQECNRISPPATTPSAATLSSIAFIILLTNFLMTLLI